MWPLTLGGVMTEITALEVLEKTDGYAYGISASAC
jgi:hypothetical protein